LYEKKNRRLTVNTEGTDWESRKNTEKSEDQKNL